MDAQKRTWAEIRLQNIAHNVRVMRSQLPEGVRFLGVVKANAYGHGAVEVAGMLEREKLADYLAVACLDEALQLRQAGIGLPILIMGYTPARYAKVLQENAITQAVGSIELARELSAALDAPLKVHFKLETGMGRTGFDPREKETLAQLQELMELPNLQAEGAFTHFAVSDEFGDPFTHGQYKRFTETLEQLEKLTGKRLEIRHCVNSGAMINYRQYCLDMVRPGLATYGMYPAAETGGIELRPAMELKSRVAYVYEHVPGDSISYGRTYILPETKRIAVVPIGYADGLHRCASGTYEFLVRGKRVPQVGRVCMDMCMIDVTNVPDCAADDIVTIFGRDGEAFLPVEEQASKAGTISYELVCAVSPRVPRVYVD